LDCKVLLIGNGAREHAISKKIVEDGGKLYSYMSRENPGIADLSEEFIIGDLTSFEKLKKFSHVDYAIVGPEQPLAVGITNYLEDILEIPTSSPRQEVAKIETSKSFARCLLDNYGISGNPSFKVCHDLDDFDSAIQELGLEVVIKPDGLTGGKGVRVYGDHFSTYNEGKAYATQLLVKEGKFIVEEKLYGQEFSLQVFTDGNNLEPMPLVRDYKRAYNGEKGPNTGSMGSYSLPDHTLPFLRESDTQQALTILQDTINALKKHTGIRYKGVLYGQFMKTDSGVYLVEFNVRFGDPEAINVLKLLKSDYDELNLSMIEGHLKSAEFSSHATVCIYLVPEGYPVQPTSNSVINITDSLTSDLYYASVYREKGLIKTTTSRAVALLSEGKSLDEARENVHKDLSKIEGKLFWRTDIGQLL